PRKGHHPHRKSAASLRARGRRCAQLGRGEKRVTIIDRPAVLPDIFMRWFASRGWTPRTHQLELLAKARAGRSALLIAPTGGGQARAVVLWLGRRRAAATAVWWCVSPAS